MDDFFHGQLRYGPVGEWHFGKRRPSGADHEEKPPGLAGVNAGRNVQRAAG